MSQVKLEDVFPMVAGQSLGSALGHSVHVYQVLTCEWGDNERHLSPGPPPVHPDLLHLHCRHQHLPLDQRRDNERPEDVSDVRAELVPPSLLNIYVTCDTNMPHAIKHTNENDTILD